MEPQPGNAFAHRINITWGDCDPARIAYTGRLTNFVLDAVNAWWEQHLDGDGWFQMELDRNIGTPYVRFEMDFHHPVTPRHPLVCHVWPEKLGNTSITFRVNSEQDGIPCFSARTVSVFTVADEFRKRAPSEDMRRVVEAKLPDRTVTPE